MRLICLFLLIKIVVLGSTLRPLTILIDFPDYRYTELDSRENTLTNQRKGEEFTRDLYAEMLYSTSTYKGSNGEELMSARSFFYLESGGSFTLEGDREDIYGWITAKKSMRYYGKNISGRGDVTGAATLVREGIERLAEDGVDFSKYDGNGDGIIDNVVVIFAGRGEQFKNSMGSNSIWPHYNTFSDISRGPYAYFKDNKGRPWIMDNFTLLPQDLPLDLYIHETGHYLGLSDLYGESSTVGYWSNMGEIYCGDIVGTKINSYGAYHRNNLQNIYNEKNIQTYWSQTKEYDKGDIEDNDIYVALHNSNHKKSDNLIKINLPSMKRRIPVKRERTYYSDNHLNRGSSFRFTVDIPEEGNNTLKMETWFNSVVDRKNARIYVKPLDKRVWRMEESKKNGRKGSKRWIAEEFDLSRYKGETIEIRGVLLPSVKEWRRGVYVSDIRVESDGKRIFDIKVDRNQIVFDGFEKTDGIEEEKRYLLIEYRQPKEGLVDEGLLRTRKNIPYPGGLVIWYIDEGYEERGNLVNILPVNKGKVYEVVRGKLVPMEELKYRVSARVISSKDIPEVAVKSGGRYYYREKIKGVKKAGLIEGISIEILDETPGKIMLKLTYGRDRM